MRMLLLALVASSILCHGARAAGPWEMKTDGGYLRGNRVVLGAGGAEKFAEQPGKGVQRFLAYDLTGEIAIVGGGEANQWEFLWQGPDEVTIRAAEGKWKGYYLNTSDRALKDGASFSFLLELGAKPQAFTVYQVAK